MHIGVGEGILLTQPNPDLLVNEVDLSHSVSLTPSPRSSLKGQIVDCGVNHE